MNHEFLLASRAPLTGFNLVILTWKSALKKMSKLLREG
jgi:hypothetical protein